MKPIRLFITLISIGVVLFGGRVRLAASAQLPPTNMLAAIQAAVRANRVAGLAAVPQAPDQAALDPRLQIIAAALRQMPLSAALATNTGPSALALKLREQRAAIEELHSRNGGEVEIHIRPTVGTPMQIKGSALERPAAATAKMRSHDRSVTTARSFLLRNRGILLLADPDRELVLDQQDVDTSGNQHLRYSQHYAGLPVWPCALSVHLNAAGNVYLLDGVFVPTPSAATTRAVVTAAEAVRSAYAAVTVRQDVLTFSLELVIYAPVDGPARLAWKVGVHGNFCQEWLVLVDGVTGSVLNRVNQCADANVPGSGIDLLGMNRPLNVWSRNGTNYMLDTSKPMFNGTNGYIWILDAGNQTTNQIYTRGRLQNLFWVRSLNPNSWAVPDAVSAAYNLSKTYDYYLQRHVRNSYDSNGANIVAVVRVANFSNAQWNGAIQKLFFGDIDAYAGSLDVVGHELTHAITQSSANLLYQGQSGALNESMSDIFGEMVEARTYGTNDWLIGTYLRTPLRDMSNPGRFNQPAHMSEFSATADDYGGVHINSGIINHAYFLLAAGLSGAIGERDAERIFYQCLTKHLHPQSQFIDARIAAIASAEELFLPSSTQAIQTAAAFDSVGIFGAPATPDPTRIPAVRANDSVLCLYNWLDSADSIWRREDAFGDPPNGTKLVPDVARRRLSVSGNGVRAVYVTSRDALGSFATDGSTDVWYSETTGMVHSVGVSPDFRYYAFVLQDPVSRSPMNAIGLIDTVTNAKRTFPLVVPTVDGETVDNVICADALSITYDGSQLIYDALSGITLPDGTSSQAWSIYGIDLITGTTRVIVPPISGLDIGNPALSHTSTRYLTFDARNQTTGAAAVFNMDLQTRNITQVSPVLSDFGYPCFNGNDSAVVYTAADSVFPSGRSLYWQPLLADHLTTNGSATNWVRNAWMGVVYRRGAYTNTNVPPTISISWPVNGWSFTYPTPIVIRVDATDSDDAVAKVEFYADSQKLGETSSSPYRFVWNDAAPGTYRLYARAIDSLGGASDAGPVLITVVANAPPSITKQPQSQTVNPGADVTLSVVATGTSPLDYQWYYNGEPLAGKTFANLTLNGVAATEAGEYSVVVRNVVGSATSAPAILTVNTQVHQPAMIKNPTLAAQTFSVSVFLQVGVTYTLESTSDLSAPDWKAVQSMPGNGGQMTLTDTNAVASERFYRVRSQ